MTATVLDASDRTGRPLPVGDLTRLWPLGGWLTLARVPGGKNEHFRLSSGDGTFYLRRSHRAKPRAELVAQLALIRFLASRGLPVPLPVHTDAGADHAVVDARLWTVTRAIEGETYDDTSPVHLRSLGRVVASVHQLTENLDGGEGPPYLLAELQARAAALQLPAPLKDATRRVVDGLTALAPDLPRGLVYGGARRGSLLFQDDQVVGVLDFDSSHRDVRVLDLAVAAHDVGKIYTASAADNKVAVDLGRVHTLLTAYAERRAFLPAEAAALPLLLQAKRLKRALGRMQRAEAGEPLSDNDLAKVALELRRLAWLDEHRSELDAACRSAIASPEG